MTALRTRRDLDSERMFALAVVRLLEVVGEVAARLSPQFRDANPHVPWRDIINLRNRLIHAYDVVDHDIVWEILHKDLPPLVVELQRLLAADGS